jgi:hypothetical protein
VPALAPKPALASTSDLEPGPSQILELKSALALVLAPSIVAAPATGSEIEPAESALAPAPELDPAPKQTLELKLALVPGPAGEPSWPLTVATEWAE